MTQLEKIKLIIGVSDNQIDNLLNVLIEQAKLIICDIRNTEVVETKFENIQNMMVVEMYNKMGMEGQIAHSELGVNMSFENSNISKSLIDMIPPKVRGL